MTYAAFRSIGAYIPSKIMTNSDFEKIIDTSDEWITKRTGIKERRLAEENEVPSDLGARAAEIAIQRAGIKKEEILAIGDQNNDIELLKAGGVSVAMGNATNELKACADYVTDAIDNDGFAKAMEKFCLKV